MAAQQIKWLALGDSYTIGEKVAQNMRYTSQIAKKLEKEYNTDISVKTIAKTGWTTDELQATINQSKIVKPYQIVSLLIGVNNQYRGRSISNFKKEFEALLKQAVAFAGDKANRVIVMSIPDWGITPFANGKDREKIAAEIDAYNQAQKAICEQNDVVFVNISAVTRRLGNQPEYLAEDKLHPSGKMYAKWAQIAYSSFESILKQQLR